MSTNNATTATPQPDDGQIAALKAVRLRAVKDAFWVTSGSIKDLTVLSEVLEVALGIAAPTKSQQRAFFDQLPDSIFGAGLAQGFESRRVRALLMKFAQGASQDVRVLIESA